MLPVAYRHGEIICGDRWRDQPSGFGCPDRVGQPSEVNGRQGRRDQRGEVNGRQGPEREFGAYDEIRLRP